MSKSEFYILTEDRAAAEARIVELEKAIQDLGPEFHVALTQSSETWHDNAPFEALADEQALYAAERHQLWQMLAQATALLPKPARGKVGVGATVTVQQGTKTNRYLLAGHWSPRTNQKVDGILVITCASPIGSALLGKKVGSTITFGPRKIEAKIVAVDV